MSAGKRHQIGLSALASLKLAEEVGSGSSGVCDAEGYPVHIAAGCDGHGHGVALQLDVWNAVREDDTHAVPQQNKALAARHRIVFLERDQNRNVVLGQGLSLVTNMVGNEPVPQSLLPRRVISRSRDIRPYADQSLTVPIPLSTHIRGETSRGVKS